MLCYIDLSQDPPQLRMETYYHNLPVLKAWSDALRLGDYPVLIEQCLQEKDFSPAPGFRCLFKHDRIEVGEGYVLLADETDTAMLVPRLAFWGLLLIVCDTFIAGFEKHEQVRSHENSAFNIRAFQALRGTILKRIERDSYQGELSFRVQDRYGLDDRYETRIATLESFPGWLPFYSQMELFDRLTHVATGMIRNHFYSPRQTHRVPVPQSHRSAFVEVLKLARVWGKQVPSALYNREDNPESFTTIAINSYHTLLEYCAHHRPQSAACNLDEVPFSPDWFYHLPQQLPKDFDPMAFTAHCEAVWNAQPSLQAEAREIQFNDWVFTIQVKDIDVGRLGFAQIVFSYPQDDDEEE